MVQHKESAYDTYLKSEGWKCNKSPSGAHFWVEHRVFPRDLSGFLCTHCGEERHFANPVKKTR